MIEYLKKGLIVIVTLVMLVSLCGCREADRVQYNISKEADNFNVTRRLTAINVRTQDVLYEITGRFSVSVDDDNDVNIIIETDEGEYKKHFIHVNDYVTYIVEDLSGADVSKYQYEISILPKAIGDFFDITTD